MVIRASGVALAAGATFKPDLKPYDRFGPRGGHVRVRAKFITLANVSIAETLFVGSELVEPRSVISSDATGQVDNFTPAVEAIGGPTDVIDLAYTNLGTVAGTLAYVVEIENA